MKARISAFLMALCLLAGVAAIAEHAPYTAVGYTTKAWALTPADYEELMENISMRIEQTQIYLCRGVIVEQLSAEGEPQLLIIDTGGEGQPQLVCIESQISNWTAPLEIGKEYRVYAEVVGVYNENIPRMIARFAYDN